MIVRLVDELGHPLFLDEFVGFDVSDSETIQDLKQRVTSLLKDDLDLQVSKHNVLVSYSEINQEKVGLSEKAVDFVATSYEYDYSLKVAVRTDSEHRDKRYSSFWSNYEEVDYVFSRKMEESTAITLNDLDLDSTDEDYDSEDYESDWSAEAPIPVDNHVLKKMYSPAIPPGPVNLI